MTDDTAEHPAVRLERDGWQALSSDGATAAAFYEARLDDQVLMLLPGGLRLDDRAQAIEAMSGQPWASYELEDVHAIAMGPGGCLVTYAVTARRGDAEPYKAYVTSGYVVRGDDDWRLAFHQQTPR